MKINTNKTIANKLENTILISTTVMSFGL